MTRFFHAFLIALFAALCAHTAQAQISLDYCRSRAQANHPIAKRSTTIEKRFQNDSAIAWSTYLPQATLSGKASTQSNVTELPFSMPGFAGLDLGTEQYQAVAELNQPIWDGGTLSAHLKSIKASAQLERSELEVNLYALLERSDQLFFNVLLLDEQLRQNRLLLDDLSVHTRRVASYVANGIANRSDLDALRVEELGAQQKSIELLAGRRASLQALSILIGEQISDDAQFEKPALEAGPNDGKSSESVGTARPEFRHFQALDALAESRKDALIAALLPRLGVFLQAGYGLPSLDMFETDPAGFWIIGGRLSWNLSGLYSLKANLNKIELDRQNIAINRDAFKLELESKVARQSTEIRKIQELLEKDEEIISLRSELKRAAEEKHANGAISVAELLREINAENFARQMRSMHEIQLAAARYALRVTLNY